ncbi:oxygenase MpaB family protein [Nocardia lijiangensis]|uniref:oxygenase MpaB family protein n=1 Tax=Nocardia lijiangensis TaxID=299618 RepID=UPI0009FD0FCC|nr:oxygenase MpaB family protein [Nocardia lijiangensis]
MSARSSLPGYFADDSMARRVMSKRAVGLTYGQRALVIGAVHPLLYVGTAENTEHRSTPYTRLALTGKLFEAVFLGSKEEADRALAFTTKKHATVAGELPEDAGPHHPAGAPYSAFDPHLMFMTMAFTFDSAEVMHDLLVRRLTDGEREGLYQDYVRWAELFGMPRDAAPADYPAFRDYFDGYLASDELFLTDEARLVGSYLAGQRVPYPQRAPLQQVTSAFFLLVQGSLPPRIRAMYGIRWGMTDELAFRALAGGVRAAHLAPPLAPRVLRGTLAGPSGPVYRLVSERERKLARTGRPSMPGVDSRNWAARNSAGPAWKDRGHVESRISPGRRA